MAGKLERQLRADLSEACMISWEKFGYHPTRFLQMLNENDAAEVAVELVSSPVPSDGFTRSWENGALHLTVEAHVIRPEYAPLFNKQTVDMARNRLRDYGYEEATEPKKLNIKQLIRDAKEKKVNKVEFTDLLKQHYKGKGREDAWIQKRIEQLWKETGRNEPTVSKDHSFTHFGISRLE